MRRRFLPIVSLCAFAVLAAAARAFPYEGGPMVETGASPRGGVAADFNDDGFDDLAVLNGVGDSVSVFFSNGDRTFGAGNAYAAGDSPVFASAGDFNEDGFPDLAVALEAVDDVAILLNDGDGTFAAAVAYPVGNVWFFGESEVADFDGDGNLDLAVNEFIDDAVAVLLGNGDGTFDAAVSYPSGGNGIAVGLFDADAVPDLVTTGGAGEYGFLSGNGDGTFDAVVLTSTSIPNIDEVASADFDEDGEADLAIGGESIDPPGSLWILLGNGDGTFDAEVEYPGIGVTAIAVDDLDGDGNLDLVTNESLYGVYLGNGDGTFDDTVFYDSGRDADVIAGDFDGDGNLDAADSVKDEALAIVAFGEGDGTLRAGRFYPMPDNPFAGAVAIADMDGDGGNDVIHPDEFNQTVSIRLGDGSGGFGPFSSYPTSGNAAGIFAADFDGDDDVDIAVGGSDIDVVSVLMGDGAGGLGAPTDAAVGDLPKAVSGGDFDGDDDVDLIVANEGDGTLSYLENDGSGSFAAAVSLPTTDAPGAMSVADFDGDLDLDVAVAHDLFDPDSLGIVLGNGDGTFSAETLYGDATDLLAPSSISAADFDNDGDLDLVLADDSDNVAGTYENDGTGAFAQVEEFADAYGNAPVGVDAADVDGDGNQDFVVSEYGYGFLVYLGNGNLTFDPQTDFQSADVTLGVVVDDLDGVENPDILLMSDEAAGFSVYLSSGFPPGGGGGFNPPPSEPMVRVVSPNGGETISAGSTFQIEWTTQGRVDFVNLAYSLDGGNGWTDIARGAFNSGLYSWNVPDVEAPSVLLRVEATDLATIFASDQSDAPFAIRDGHPVLLETVVEGLRAFINLQTGCRFFEEDASLNNPQTGLPEHPGEVCPGDFITTPSFRTVYYVTRDFIRRPFFNALVFLTHQPSFQGVKTVTDATLLTLKLGDLMAPRPGTVLVKFTGDSRDVYALFENPADPLKPIARLLESEAAASANFGPAWADFVIDLPPTMVDLFEYGAPIFGKEEIDTSTMLRRRDLEAVTNPYTFAVLKKIGDLIAEKRR